MKIRNDFVTNSSSSSYVCDICGREESGYDVDFRDFGLNECDKCGSIFCDEHISFNNIDVEELKKELENCCEVDKHEIRNFEGTAEELIEEVHDEIRYEIPPILCPICSFVQISTDDIEMYKNIELQKSDDTIKNEILNRFKDFDEFKDFLNKNKANLK